MRLEMDDGDETDTVETLAKNGPSTSETIAHPSAAQRRKNNILRCNPMGGCKAVWYLPDQDPARVLTAWINENDAVLKARDVDQRELASHVSDPFDETLRELHAEDRFEWLFVERDRSEQSEQDEHECPRCGNAVKNLPRHIRACDGGSD